MRRLSTIPVALLFLVAVAAPAAAEPRATSPSAPAEPARAGTLSDRDADRISDAFEPKVDAARSSDRFDVLVTFRPGTSDAAGEARDDVGSFPTSREYRIIPGFAGRMSAAQIRALAKNPNVHRIEEDVRLEATLDHSRADFGIERARADFPGVTGAGIDVCVADTGVDPAHEQLDSKTIVWTDETPNPSATPVDPQGHGTHVASIAVGDGIGGVNAATFRGVAPAADLFVARVLDADGFGEDSWIIAGVEWCVDQGVDVISMSLGTLEGSDGLDALSLAVNNAVSAGVTTIIAAGNSGDAPESVGSPGAAAGAITVGAVAEWSAPPNAGAGRHSDGVYLAPFSSRGPTVGGGTIKPDVAAPGITVAAALAGTTATYASLSGTSMATPFVAGTAALALDANPLLPPSGVRALIEGTAQDRGAAEKDNDWGAGLLDGYAVVAEAFGAGSYATTDFPAYSRLSGSVPNNSVWSHEFTVGPNDLTVPIAAMITADGEKLCTLPWFDPPCLVWEWTPDLEARLIAPNGAILSESTCAADEECGIGRQETVHAMPTTSGTYRIEVYTFADWPNDGKGGSFWLDLSRGPVGSGPPPSPGMHVGDVDASFGGRAGKTPTITITVHDANHAAIAGVTVTGSWSAGGTASCVTDGTGRCSVSKGFAKKQTSLTFTVTGLAKSGYIYDAGSNHDPDGDSNGTSITVTKP